MYLLKKFLKSETGATAIEYALIATLISVAIIGGATAVGNNVSTGLNEVGDTFESL